jgi:surface protein
MFLNCSAFNQSVSNWDVSKVTTMQNMFYGCTKFNNGGGTGLLFANGKAPTSALTTTLQMFLNCSAFNQSVSNWDVSKVTTMRDMFVNCTAFNQPLDTWTLSALLDSNGMLNLFRDSGLSKVNLNLTLIHWAMQYTNSSPSTPFPTGVQLTNSPLSPSGAGITDGYDILTALPTDSPPGPGWTITPVP